MNAYVFQKKKKRGGGLKPSVIGNVVRADGRISTLRKIHKIAMCKPSSRIVRTSNDLKSFGGSSRSGCQGLAGTWRLLETSCHRDCLCIIVGKETRLEHARETARLVGFM